MRWWLLCRAPVGVEGRVPVAALVGRLVGVLSEIRSGDAGAPVAASVGGPVGAAARSGRVQGWAAPSGGQAAGATTASCVCPSVELLRPLAAPTRGRWSSRGRAGGTAATER